MNIFVLKFKCNINTFLWSSRFGFKHPILPKLLELTSEVMTHSKTDDKKIRLKLPIPSRAIQMMLQAHSRCFIDILSS
jgi:hypothetical protein